MTRFLLAAAVVLLILALVCLVGSTTIAGANWETWLVAALLSWALDELLGGIKITSR